MKMSPARFNGDEMQFSAIKDDRLRLLAQRKLTLLVDLDQTLIHTTSTITAGEIEGVHRFRLSDGGRWYHTRIRPGTEAFLKNISNLFEMHVVTFGNRRYADKIVSLLDPSGDYFQSRILSRDESIDKQYKSANLERLFPFGDEMVCMIDDRRDVWKYARNLVAVKPYVFFAGVGDMNAPPGTVPGSQTVSDSELDVDYLFYLEGTLREVHEKFFEEFDEESFQNSIPDLKLIVPSVQKRPLKGAIIAFSGCFPRNQSLESFEICSLASSLGAEIRDEVSDEVTHLIAARPDTSKVRKARKLDGIKVVSREWLRCSAELWKWASEEHFFITDTDDMIAKKIAKSEAKRMRKERRTALKRDRQEALVPSLGTDQEEISEFFIEADGVATAHDDEKKLEVADPPRKKPKRDHLDQSS